MTRIDIDKIFGGLKKLQPYDPEIKHTKMRQIMLAIYRNDLDFSDVAVGDILDLIHIYDSESPEIEDIEVDLGEIAQMLTTLQKIQPRRGRDVFL